MLSTHASNHWALFLQIQEAHRVLPQISVPSEYQRVGFFLESLLLCTHVNLRVQKAKIEGDLVLHDNFDLAVVLFTPEDPVEQKKVSTKEKNKSNLVAQLKAHIKAAGATPGSLGKSPIMHNEYQWHTQNKEQKASLKT